MNRWSNALLDAMRGEGDPLADRVVADLHAEGRLKSADNFFRSLVTAMEPPAGAMPASFDAYLEATAPDAFVVDEPRLLAGQRLFAQYGPEMSMVLATYSLPASYCAAKGVEVLWRTGKLYTNPRRRVLETAQMLIDALQPGGLSLNGAGIRTAQRVRLMHAGVRFLLLNHPDEAWDLSLGVPINQEDMAGTQCTFSYVVLDGLDRLSIPLSDEERESYLYAWEVIGLRMGLRPELLPQNFAEARVLTDTIHARQVRPCEAGRHMMAALVTMLEENTPGTLVDGIGPTLIRNFIDDEALCDGMGVPPADWTRGLLHVLDDAMHALGLAERKHPMLRRAARELGLRVLQGMVSAERGGTRPSFAIPESLAEGWGAYARHSS